MKNKEQVIKSYIGNRQNQKMLQFAKYIFPNKFQ